MRKLQYEERLIEQATAFNETDDQEILDARAKFKELENKYNNENELVNRLVAEINAYEKELARLIVVRDNMNKERRRKK